MRRAGRGACARLALALLAAWAGTARGHGFDPALLDLTEGQAGQYAAVWKRAPGPAALLPRFPPRCRASGAPPAAIVLDLAPQRWRLDCGAGGLAGATIGVEGLDARGDVVVRVAWRDGRVTTGVLRGDAPALALPAGPASGAGAVLRSYLGLGVQHILLGPDHLLFVLGLLLLAAGWPALLRTVTAFTLAHSLTLALAAPGLVAVPAAPVEATIALSIAAVALELLRDPAAPPTLARRAPWLVAFAFGLLHGLGFAGALGEIGLPPGHVPLALLAFNAGVEVGQLAFVAAVLPLLAGARRIAAGRPAVARLPAYAIGALAVAWTLERVLAFWTPPA